MSGPRLGEAEEQLDAFAETGIDQQNRIAPLGSHGQSHPIAFRLDQRRHDRRAGSEQGFERRWVNCELAMKAMSRRASGLAPIPETSTLLTSSTAFTPASSPTAAKGMPCRPKG